MEKALVRQTIWYIYVSDLIKLQIIFILAMSMKIIQRHDWKC